MKPFEDFGITLENTREIDTAATTMEFVAGTNSISEEFRTAAERLGAALRIMIDQEVPTATIASPADATLIKRSLRWVTTYHFDESVRQNAKDMTHGHDAAVDARLPQLDPKFWGNAGS